MERKENLYPYQDEDKDDDRMMPDYYKIYRYISNPKNGPIPPPVPRDFDWDDNFALTYIAPRYIVEGSCHPGKVFELLVIHYM